MSDLSNIFLNKHVIDLSGKRFYKLLVLDVHHKKEVIKRNGHKQTYYYWRCKCDCGNEIIRAGDSLRHGATKSCGCDRSDKMILAHKSKSDFKIEILL